MNQKLHNLLILVKKSTKNTIRRFQNMNYKQLLTLCLVTVMTLLYLGTQPALLDKNVQNDDNRSLLTAYLSMFGYHQFDNDTIAEAVSVAAPPGHKLIYKLASYFFDIMTVPKLIQIALTFILIYFGYKIGSLFIGRLGGIFSVSILLTSEWILSSIAGGMPHSFASVFYIILLYFLLKNSKVGVLIIACASSLFYPMATVVSLASFGILMLKDFPQKSFAEYARIEKKNFLWLGTSLIFILLITLPYKLANDAKVGELYSFQETITNPHFKEGGRLGNVSPLPFSAEYVGGLLKIVEGRRIYSPGRTKIFVDTVEKNKEEWKEKHSKTKILLMNAFIEFKKNLFNLQEWNISRGDPVGFAMYILVPLLLLLIGWFRIPGEALVFLAAAFLCYLISSLVAFALYHPARYVSFPLAILFSQLYPIGLGYSLKKKSISNKKSVLIILTIFILFFTSKMIFMGPALTFNIALNSKVENHQQEVYNFLINKVPQDSITAGVLREMDGIPLFAKRRILISYETSLVWWKGFNEKVVLPRTKAVCLAYFASSDSPLRKLRNEFDVDYLLVSKKDLKGTEYPKGYMFTPFNDIGQKLFIENKGSFFLENPPKEAIAFEDSTYFLIDLNKLN